MQIKFLENNTGEVITFRRYVLSGVGWTQTEQTHILEIVPGFNALPDEAAEVPPYYGFNAAVGKREAPPYIPTFEQVHTDEYFERSRVALMLGDEMLWSYSDFYADGELMSSPGDWQLEKRGDLKSRGGIEMVGGHGKITTMKKLTFTRTKITYAIVTEEEFERIMIELAAR
ncbi:MAG: hypothetical protein ACPGFA_04025 [Pikeienuella sp.]